MQKEVGQEKNNDHPGVESARVIFLKRGRRPTMPKVVGLERNNDHPGVASARVIFFKRGRRLPMQIGNLTKKKVMLKRVYHSL